jgi:hypothetical protein
MDNMEKDFIKDGLDNNKIIEIIKKIREVIDVDSSDKMIEKLKKENEFFAERYPMLFDLSTRAGEEFNWEYLNYFLSMRNKIINDELTSEKASVIVGNEWYNKHVKINENENGEIIPPKRFVRKTKRPKN